MSTAWTIYRYYRYIWACWLMQGVRCKPLADACTGTSSFRASAVSPAIYQSRPNQRSPVQLIGGRPIMETVHWCWGRHSNCLSGRAAACRGVRCICVQLKIFSPQLFHCLVLSEKGITSFIRVIRLGYTGLVVAAGSIKSSAFEWSNCEQSDLMMNTSTLCTIAAVSLCSSQPCQRP